LGQNFLIDKNILGKCLTLSNVQPYDTIVEVGPGLGTLTTGLLRAGCTVYAIEYDETLYNHLQQGLKPFFDGTLHLMKGDAVKVPLAGLPEQVYSAFKIISNLPYAITTPWLEQVLSGPLPEIVTLMIQKEASDRLWAEVGTKKYAAISIYLRSAFDLHFIHPVAPSCFYPEPAVASTLIGFKRKQQPFVFKPKTKTYIRSFFTQRRKQIQGLCNQKNEPLLVEWLYKSKIPPNTRPEAIPLEAWQALDTLI
jgi:16S rRNA (adenine1518-N6/adenine1519-N6)-dimethyltransferase